MVERYCCDQKCNDNQGRGTCPFIHAGDDEDDFGEPLSTLENLQFWTPIWITAAVVVGFVCYLIWGRS